ncbi:hypothetical protein LPJ70_003592 [Coemansia sp. RSA 2708]|nr:hypothetical protein LPJ70_003592 [Coemansia sp. RSA 2708]
MKGGGANSNRKRRARNHGARGATSTGEACAADGQTEQAAGIPGTASPGKQAQMVFTVGTFDEDDHSSDMRAAADTEHHGLPANAVARHAHAARKPLFTMGSHSEMSDIDGVDAASLPRPDKAHSAVATRHPGPANQDAAQSLPRSPSQLHACKAMTSLTELGALPPAHGSSAPASDGDGSDAAPDELRNAAADQALRGKARAARDGHAKTRKKVASKKAHVKKAASSAALRTRMRQGTVLRRDAHPKLQALHGGDGGHGDSSYVDYSGSSSSSSGSSSNGNGSDGVAEPGAPQPSQHSSTATLGAASDDSTTTASIGSTHPAGAATAGRPSEPPAPEALPQAEPAPRVQDRYVAKSIKRNMESQRQQSMVEKEEEDMEITCALLTGVPRRRNRPPGMTPQAFLAPDSPAYRQQVRKSERVYAHVRAMAHPLLESIARCVTLREARSAVAARDQPWARRAPEPRADWWESLLPPLPPRETRAAPFARLHLDPPAWSADGARAAAYGAEPGADAGCSHVRELRARADDLRFMRQHALAAGRPGAVRAPAPSPAAHETWHGRRVPGLQNVATFSATPLTLTASDDAASDSALARSNPLAPPYRRHGTVYGYTASAAAAPAHGAPSTTLRRHDSIPTSRPATASIHESDPRRSSYFDRLSIDEDRQMPASAAAPAPTGLLRRVISGLTGGSSAFGSSQ